MSRLVPTFMIIGERKCGTSSLYRYLLAHPEVLPCRQKETDFFSNSSSFLKKNLNEYLQYFPDINDDHAILNWIELGMNGQLLKEEMTFNINPETHYITGEASANVLSTVHPKKIKKYFPEMKFVVMMRNPVERALSQHKMFVRFKQEGRKWSWLVGQARRDIKVEMMLLKLGINGPYVGPGQYLRNIKKWLRVFRKDQFFFLRTEDLQSPSLGNARLQELCGFLRISPFDFESVLNTKHNESPTKTEDHRLMRVLSNYYEGPNRELERFLGVNLNWNNGL